MFFQSSLQNPLNYITFLNFNLVLMIFIKIRQGSHPHSSTRIISTKYINPHPNFFPVHLRHQQFQKSSTTWVKVKHKTSVHGERSTKKTKFFFFDKVEFQGESSFLRVTGNWTIVPKSTSIIRPCQNTFTG